MGRKKPEKEVNGEDFLNPYNFIEPLEIVPKESYQSYQNQSGLSGTITCELEVLKKLFIPDTRKDDKPSFEFYKNEAGEYSIPASSLRGMLRTVIEAISSSCFAVREDERFSYRPKGFPDQKVGRITKMPTEGQTGELELLNKTRVKKKRIEDYNNLDELYITLTDGGDRGPKVKDIITDLSQDEKEEIDDWGPISKNGKKIYKGYLYKRNGRYGGFPKRENEKVFYQDKAKDQLEKYNFSYQRREDYNYIVEQKCKDTDNEGRKSKYQLKDNDENRLLYFTLDKNKEVKFVSDTEVPKWRYQYSPEDLMENQGLLGCNSLDNLCYACRLFGMIGGEDSQASYKGKLDFVDAE
ncbi:MAG: hypothetical protein ACQEP9_03980, partial [Bacillota bacterium]